MRDWYDVKVRCVMGSEATYCQEIRILGRTLRWRTWGLEYEADEKHRELLLRGLGLEEDSKAASSAAVRADEFVAKEDEEPLEAGEARKFRGLAATLNYLGGG